jgi:hypothetical protein
MNKMNKIIFEDGKTKQSFIVSEKEFNKLYNLVAPKKDKKIHSY